MARRLGCVWVPGFAAEVERARHPRADEPLLVLEGERVLAACARATAAGVRPGDRLASALARCPAARTLPADRTHYQSQWQRLLEALALHTPTVEPSEGGRAYLEAAGLGRLYGGEEGWCQAIRREARLATRLLPHVGVAGTRFAAWVAASTAQLPFGCRLVDGGDREFLAPFPIERLPLPEEALRRLRLLGVRTIGRFATWPVTEVAEQLGPDCLPAHRWARGLDDGPLAGERPQVWQVRRAFDPAEDRREALLASLLTMGHEALGQIGRREVVVRRLHLGLSLASGDTWGRETWVGEPLGPHRLEALLDGLLTTLPAEGGGVAEATLRLSGTGTEGGRQLSLFAHAARRERLEGALQRLARKYPPGAVARARPVSPDAPLSQERYALEAYPP